MKKILLTLAILVFGIIAVLMLFTNKENVSIEVPQTPTYSPTLIEKYIKENISTLAPEKEQLGGTFFVTNIVVEQGTGTVEYEDGHNAYTADFTYSVNADGAVVISRFVIRE